MNKFKGTIKHVVVNNEKFWQVSGPEPYVMLKRIIPSYNSPERGVINVHDNIQNIEYLKWLMVLYPLDILTKEKWNESLKTYFDLQKRKQHLDNLELKEPSKQFNGTLLPFQKLCLDFLEKTNGTALVADEMGLGKTVETLAYLATAQNSFPVLVVAPLVVLNHWKNEVKKFIRVFDQDGLIPELPVEPKIIKIRSGKPEKLPKADVYIINYDLLAKRVDDIKKTGVQSLVYDEVHSLRHSDSKKYGAADQMINISTVKHALGLSGTPIYNHGDEIFNIVNLLYPGLLGTYKEFYDQYCETEGYNSKVKISEDKRDALHEKLTATIMIRRKKEDVLKELPEKTRITDKLEIDHAYYNAEIEKIFQKLEEEIERIKNDDEKKKSRQFEISAAMDRAFNSERSAAGMAKLPYVIKYIETILENEEKVVVFCHHIIMHESLMKSLEKYNPCNVVGGQSDAKRQENIDDFQNNPDKKIIIVGLRAGSVGISLTSARYVLFAELDWSPSIHKQAEDRLHRYGQKNAVMAHYLVGEGTLDESIVGVLVDKTLEIDAIMGDKREQEDTLSSRAYLEELKQKILIKHHD